MTKTFTFAVMHFSVAFGVAYGLTGSIVIGGAVALIEPAVNTVGFYFHERAWQKIEARKRRRHQAAQEYNLAGSIITSRSMMT